jgi:transcription initiation factor TFIIIB Brf1 subunit/transcription initiation factor TFIIB
MSDISDELEIFNQVCKVLQNINISDIENDINLCENIELNKKKEKCKHINIINENGTSLCTDCGEEILKQIMHEKEWRYYGQSDTKHASDPNRVQPRKQDERTIYKDVENMGFSEKTVTIANKMYMEVTQGKIKRGDSRKAMVFACIYLAYKATGKPQPHENFLRVFKITKKDALQGLKNVVLYAPKSSVINSSNITPLHLIDNIMNMFKITEKEIEDVKNLYYKIYNKNSRLNRSRPQSTAAGLIYYWILINNKDIPLKTFAKKVELSELTISKVAKIIEDVLNNNK